MKNKQIILLLMLSAICVFSACSRSNLKDKITLKKPTLSKEKVEDVLVDLHLVEAVVRVNIFQDTLNTLQNQAKQEAHKILRKHQCTYADFYYSMQYYMAEPEACKQMMENVVSRLVELEVETNKNKQTNSNKQ